MTRGHRDGMQTSSHRSQNRFAGQADPAFDTRREQDRVPPILHGADFHHAAVFQSGGIAPPFWQRALADFRHPQRVELFHGFNFPRPANRRAARAGRGSRQERAPLNWTDATAKGRRNSLFTLFRGNTQWSALTLP